MKTTRSEVSVEANAGESRRYAATKTLNATVAGRLLTLYEGDAPRLTISLDQGGRHRLVAGDGVIARDAVAALEDCPGVSILPASGGLLGNLTVADNFALLLRYDTDTSDRNVGDRDLDAALQHCGLTPQRIAILARQQPMNLEPGERWKIGFVRYLLRPPELLVIDRLFAGLTRRQANGLIAVEAVYHARHPFRPVLFVDLDSHELPTLPDCRSSTELAELEEQ